MRRLRLPPDLAEKLQPLAELPAAAIHQMAQDLDNQLVLKLVLDDDVSSIVHACAALRDVDPDTRDALVVIVTGLHYLKASSGELLPQIIEDIVDIYTEDNKPSHALVKNLRVNLDTIFSISKVRASLKALELLNDRDKLYLQSRIISSLRPVFDDDLTKPCLASLITHSMKIVVRSGGESSYLYISLDSDDLRELRRNIDKAINKAASISAKLTSSTSGEFGEIIEVENLNE